MPKSNKFGVIFFFCSDKKMYQLIFQTMPTQTLYGFETVPTFSTNSQQFSSSDHEIKATNCPRFQELSGAGSWRKNILKRFTDFGALSVTYELYNNGKNVENRKFFQKFLKSVKMLERVENESSSSCKWFPLECNVMYCNQIIEKVQDGVARLLQCAFDWIINCWAFQLKITVLDELSSTFRPQISDCDQLQQTEFYSILAPVASKRRHAQVEMSAAFSVLNQSINFQACLIGISPR